VDAYKVLIKPAAGKELSTLGRKQDRQRLVEKIAGLAVNPRPPGASKLTGYSDRYRIRQGNFRVVYLIDDERREVTVFKVGDRKHIHK
jgi:mRNA interferase RelE/StbE